LASAWGGSWGTAWLETWGAGASPVVAVVESSPAGVRHAKRYEDYLSLEEYIRSLTKKAEPKRKKRRELRIKLGEVDARVESIPEVRFLKEELDRMYSKDMPLIPTEIATLKSIVGRVNELQMQLDDEDVLLLL
jgi:hypothetical protein